MKKLLPLLILMSATSAFADCKISYLPTPGGQGEIDIESLNTAIAAHTNATIVPESEANLFLRTYDISTSISKKRRTYKWEIGVLLEDYNGNILGRKKIFSYKFGPGEATQWSGWSYPPVSNDAIKYSIRLLNKNCR